MMTDSRPRIAVLLAAYNGVRWLREQLISILNQEGVLVSVFISVDQSTDDTLTWCRNFSRDEPRLTVLPDKGVRYGGAARNFFRLLRDVDFSSFDYVSFADQDDIYLPRKYIAAHEKMSELGAAGYSGNVTAFWPDGRTRLIVKSQAQRKLDFLYESGGAGCTYVLKTEAALRFKAFIIDNWSCVEHVALHDWLAYAWFRANGVKWVIDSIPYVLYRQHGGNQIGANSGWSAVLSRCQLIRSGWYRSEIRKIAVLVGGSVRGLPVQIKESGVTPLWFLVKNLREFRRSSRENIFFVCMSMIKVV